MNILNIDLNRYKEKVIEIYIKIFGKEYETIIRNRIESVEIVTYNSQNGVREYKLFLENCKIRELSLEFLNKIGVDVSKIKEKSFAKELPDEIRRLVSKYIGGYSGFSYLPEYNILGIRAFDKKTIEINKKYKSDIIENQIEFINFLNQNDSIVDEYDLKEFLKTEEGKEFLKKVYEYNEIYDEILAKYQEFTKTLKELDEFLEYRKYTDITKTEEFKKISEIFSKISTEENIENYIIYLLDKGEIFVTINADKAILFFTVLDGGVVDYTMLHEFCHVIEKHSKGKEKIGSGFDITEIKNPYRPEKRKYERLNENITDIFSIQGTRILHERGEYLLEPKEIVLNDIMDENTSMITKNMLMPFLKKYKKEIIRARITGDINDFLELIGKDNFEELNDCINIVDYLVYEKELAKKLRERVKDKKRIKNNINNEDEGLIKEYEKQLQRLDKIYINMEENLKSNEER